MPRLLILSLLCPVFVCAQIASIGVQLTKRGELKILSPGESYSENAEDSVYYTEESNPEIVLGQSCNEFNQLFMLVPQVNYWEQRMQSDFSNGNWNNSRYLAATYTYIPKSKAKKEPKPALNIIPDHYWPNSALSPKDKATIKKLLLTYVTNNYALDNWNLVIDSWQTLHDTLSPFVREAVIYQYTGQKLTGVISYDDDWNVINYDQLYYNFKGQLTFLHRKSVGETGGITYSFHYDKNNRLAHFNTVQTGFMREAYEESTDFYYQYYMYDTNGLLSTIAWQGNTVSPMKIIKWR